MCIHTDTHTAKILHALYVYRHAYIFTYMYPNIFSLHMTETKSRSQFKNKKYIVLSAINFLLFKFHTQNTELV